MIWAIRGIREWQTPGKRGGSPMRGGKGFEGKKPEKLSKKKKTLTKREHSD
jgi:hypothetical protein